MKQQIENLQANIGKLMQEHFSASDFDTVTILSPLLSRVQDYKSEMQILSVKSLRLNPP